HNGGATWPSTFLRSAAGDALRRGLRDFTWRDYTVTYSYAAIHSSLWRCDTEIARGNMSTQTMINRTMTDLERFLAVMEYEPVDRVPNWELGVWPQTRERWEREGLDMTAYHWDWFTGESAMHMDPREFIRFNGSLIPPFDEETMAEDERTVTFRDSLGRVRQALKEGATRGGRMSMDTYLSFPVSS